MEPKIADSLFVLAVQNLEASSDFYKNKMGFNLHWEAPGWKCWKRDCIRVMMGECPDDVPAFETGCHSYFAYFNVVNVDAFFQEYFLQGIVTSHVADKPWGLREFTIITNDGHRITVGEEIKK